MCLVFFTTCLVFFESDEVGEKMRGICSGKKDVKVFYADVYYGNCGMWRRGEDVVCDRNEAGRRR